MAKGKDGKKVYSFPTKSRCPHCDTIDTQAVSTQGKVQYRQCLRIGCRQKYAVKGTLVKSRKQTEKEPNNDKTETTNDQQTDNTAGQAGQTTEQSGDNQQQAKPANGNKAAANTAGNKSK